MNQEDFITQLKFNEQGLIPAIVQDADTKDVRGRGERVTVDVLGAAVAELGADRGVVTVLLHNRGDDPGEIKITRQI